MTHERVLLLILDGIGFNPDLEAAILFEIWDQLDREVTDAIFEIGTNSEVNKRLCNDDEHDVSRALFMTPTLLTQAHRHLDSGLLKESDIPKLQEARAKLHEVRVKGRSLADHIHAARAKAAYKHKYIPWCIKTPTLWKLREENPTFVTHPYGIYAGYPDIAPKPAIMGNSDTGHQQISNLCVAKQISSTITDKIETGEFFQIDEWNNAMRDAAAPENNGGNGQVVARFMASGEFGDDGFVHSCFPHFEGFLRLYFEELKLPAEKLKIQLILDGRDSPPYASTDGKEENGMHRGDFLRKVKERLAKYDAVGCVGWIVGRQYMDRDYKGAMIRADYELLAKNKGRAIKDFDTAYETVKADHSAGIADPSIEGMVIGDPKPVDGNTVFVNLQFRADRQEPITACLLGLKDFVMKQAEAKKKVDSWDNCDWFADLDGLKMFTLADYNSDFTAAGCVPIATDAPHAHNLLHLLHENAPDFRFFFLGEGVKEKHVGMFSRGRRSQPLSPNEDRMVIPSYGKEDGVANDNDFWKKPMMRHPEIGDKLVELLGQKEHDYILVNVPGADMVGHLIPHHFDAGIETLESLETFTKQSLEAAAANGWHVIVTADHGNLEHFATDHGINDIMTTVIVHPESRFAGQEIKPTITGGNTARLFDNAATALYLMGREPELEGKIPPFPAEVSQNPNRLIGQSLIN